jgi:alcohol dehydrogenase
MLGAAHSCANPLTAHFGIVHGVAVGIMLPHVVRLNAADPVAAEVYGRLSPGQDLAAQLTEWLRAAGLPVRLRDAGVPDAASLAPLAPEAAAQWTAQFNPVAVTADECAALYKAAW